MNARGPYWLNWLKGLDYFAAVCCGIPAGIYVSSYVAYKRIDTKGRFPWPRLEQFINWLMRDDFHCLKSLGGNTEDIRRYYGD